MRLKTEIESELTRARKHLEDLEKEFSSNDDRGLDRFMFLGSIKQLLEGANKRVLDLEEELEQFTQSGSVQNMTS
ncbi:MULTISPECIES: hypothetical protein [Legionella]|uniref:Coiled-coil protein n=1 Tax=Legionella resiliens TaxID=2905958 RepID=A0ABS8X0Z4_9GAMM|nr:MULTISPECIES: hypothetical protein [unclassified Legionella]MCE0721813.1 hypothetical protein [Legionella sp. 9fVS26]MCE3530967.1 hypothetical protein [Legionella sp. 8cVS16]QLZ70528.1 hypothetical protein FOLKNPGA_03342 [Legionella sp. PC1000]